MFSSMRICPAFKEWARAINPVISPENSTSLFSNSPKRFAIGAKDNSLDGSPLGLPRWATTMIEQSASSSFLIVLSEATIRPSSVITPSLIGTFRSQRNRTLLFCRVRSERVLIPI